MIKKVAFTLSLITALTSFIYFTYKPKDNIYTLTEGEVIMLFNTNVQVKQILPTSQAPAITVTQINYSIDSIQKVIMKQYQNFHPDTLTPKKK